MKVIRMRVQKQYKKFKTVIKQRETSKIDSSQSLDLERG